MQSERSHTSLVETPNTYLTNIENFTFVDVPPEEIEVLHQLG